MKEYKLKKKDIVAALENLRQWVNNNFFEKSDDLEVFSTEFQRMLQEMELNCADPFGTEGYERTILEVE